MPNKPMHNIEKQAYDYSQARQILIARAALLNNKMKALQREHEGDIKKAIAVAVQHENKLKETIEANRDLFVKPKTVEFYGVRLGLKKGRGSITIADESMTIELIKKHLGPKSKNLIENVEKLYRAGLDALNAKELKKIGVTAIGGVDSVFIKDTKNPVDKMIDALVKDLSK